MWIDHAWAEDANTLTVVMTDLKNCLDGFSKALLNGQAQNEDRRSQSQCGGMQAMRLKTLPNPEVVFNGRPLKLYIEVPTATSKIAKKDGWSSMIVLPRAF